MAHANWCISAGPKDVSFGFDGRIWRHEVRHDGEVATIDIAINRFAINSSKVTGLVREARETKGLSIVERVLSKDWESAAAMPSRFDLYSVTTLLKYRDSAGVLIPLM